MFFDGSLCFPVVRKAYYNLCAVSVGCIGFIKGVIIADTLLYPISAQRPRVGHINGFSASPDGLS